MSQHTRGTSAHRICYPCRLFVFIRAALFVRCDIAAAIPAANSPACFLSLCFIRCQPLSRR
jgi:hypothetical protein